MPTSSLGATPRTPKESAERGRGDGTPKSRRKKSSTRDRASERVSTSPDAQAGGSSARQRGSLFRDAEDLRASARARDEATEFTSDGVDEAALSFEELVER